METNRKQNKKKKKEDEKKNMGHGGSKPGSRDSNVTEGESAHVKKHTIDYGTLLA